MIECDWLVGLCRRHGTRSIRRCAPYLSRPCGMCEKHEENREDDEFGSVYR